MKKFTTPIIAGFVGLPLLYALSVRPAINSAPANGHRKIQARSELQADEFSLAGDMKLLRSDLRCGAGKFAVAKDRNFVRQDLLNIVMDRWRPAEELEDLERDQDLASILGDWFAAPARELIQNLIAPSHS